jgi:hypothetical protein
MNQKPKGSKLMAKYWAWLNFLFNVQEKAQLRPNFEPDPNLGRNQAQLIEKKLLGQLKILELEFYQFPKN